MLDPISAKRHQIHLADGDGGDPKCLADTSDGDSSTRAISICDRVDGVQHMFLIPVSVMILASLDYRSNYTCSCSRPAETKLARI